MRFWAAKVAKASVRSSAARSGPGGWRAITPRSSGGIWLEADQVGRRAEHAEVAALQSRPIAWAAACWICSEKPRFACASAEFKRGLHERLLERVAVVEHFQMGLGNVGGEPRGDVVGDHDGGEHVARLDLRDRLRARGGRHGFDLVEELVGILADVDAAPADLDSRPGVVSLTTATRGLAGPRESASPISSAIATG